jgi:hypothetical protein
MRADPKLIAFIEQALAAGVPQASLVGILSARGWPEKEVYAALADYYQHTVGIDIPGRSSTGASAKEAFFYLLTFSTLATWTVGFGALAFALIDRWFRDPLFSNFNPNFNTYTVSSSLAAVIVAFPLYLFVSRVVIRESTEHPEKLDSGVRKWLTYLALVVAACVFMGDLITALSYLLRGELTSRFIAKAGVVLALSGGVFYYYFGGLRRTDMSDTPTRLRRDRVMALLSSGLVALAVILGFSQSGTPKSQRSLRADAQRTQDIYRLSMDIKNYWTGYASQLPTGLDQVSGGSYADPVTGLPYSYRPKQGSQYELCATFSRKSERNDLPGSRPWALPAGYYCFPLDASMPAASVPSYSFN